MLHTHSRDFLHSTSDWSPPLTVHVCPRQLVYKETQLVSYTCTLTCTLKRFLTLDWSPPLTVLRPLANYSTRRHSEYMLHTHSRNFLHSSSDWSPPLTVVRPRLPSPTSVQGDTVNTMLHTHSTYTHHLTGVLLSQWYDHVCPRQLDTVNTMLHTHSRDFLHSSSDSGTTTSALANYSVQGDTVNTMLHTHSRDFLHSSSDPDHVCPRQLVYKETQGDTVNTMLHTLKRFLTLTGVLLVRPRLPSPTSVQGDTVNTMHSRNFLHSSSDWIRPRLPSPTSVQGDTMLHTHSRDFLHSSSDWSPPLAARLPSPTIVYKETQ